MEEFFHFENLTPHGGFSTAWLANQPFGEVDPTFYADFMDELEEDWKIMDYRYTSHIVKCNKDLIFPLLKEGWTQMKDVFGFTDQQDITLFYYGHSLFGIISSKPLQNNGQLPIYHSHAYLPGRTSHFCVRLSADIIDKPFMNVFCEFEDFIRNSNVKYMNVCCANGAKWDLQVATTDLPFKTTSIGPRWSEFCNKFGFAEGDIMTFKFGNLVPYNIVHVYKSNV